MKYVQSSKLFAMTAFSLSLLATAQADESLLGITSGAETLPKGAAEIIQQVTYASDKGAGTYNALRSQTEFEYGFSNRLTGSIYILAQSVESKGLLVDGYIPADHEASFEFSGIQASLKYNILSPAKDFIGLATSYTLSQTYQDAHSGQKKKSTSFTAKVNAQKYFLDGELIFMFNAGIESTMARRAPVQTSVEWSTQPEAEIGFRFATGLSYRFVPKWFIGAEILYDTEFETEVGQERWSYQAGPSLHYGSQKWWATLSWLPQLSGGREQFAEQDDKGMHLIERTKQEVRFKIAVNF